MFEWQAGGRICIGPSIRRETRLILCCHPISDLTAEKQFQQLALWRTWGGPARVINVDGHPAYARAIAELRSLDEFGRRCRCRPSPYWNHVIEQDHRFIKKRISASLGFRSVEGAP